MDVEEMMVRCRGRSLLLAGVFGGAAAALLSSITPAQAECDPGFTEEADTVACTGSIPGDVDALAGDDAVDWQASLDDGSLFLGAGNDQAVLTDGTISGDVRGGAGADTITLNGTSVIGTVGGDEGDDTLLLLSGSAGAVDGGDGADTITLDGATIGGTLAGGGSADVILLSQGEADIVDGGEGDDAITLAGAVIGTRIAGGTGADVITIAGGTIIAADGGVDGGEGDDRIEMSAGDIDGIISGGAGNDVILLSGGDAGGVDGGDGDDRIELLGATVSGVLAGGRGSDTILLVSGSAQTIEGGEDADTIRLTGSTVTTIDGGAGDDALELVAGSADGILGGEGDDRISLEGSTVGSIDGGAGDDTLIATLGRSGSIAGGDGADTILLDGAEITGAITGDAGADVITLRAGTVATVSGGDDDDVILLSGAIVDGAIDGGEGDDTIEIADGVAITVIGGNGADTLIVSGGTVLEDLMAGGGDDVITLSAGTVDGTVDAGSGDDRVTVSNGFNLPAVAAFAGGEDTDVLRFESIAGSLSVPVTDWERLEIGAGADIGLAGESYSFGVSDLSPFDPSAPGIVIEGGGTLRTLAPVTALIADIGLAGALDMRDGGAGDRVLIDGDLEAAGGTVGFDVGNGVTDRLLVTGDAAGALTLAVEPVDRAFAAPGRGPGDGVSLIQVAGDASALGPRLAGGYVAGGPFQYRLATFDPGDTLADGLDPLLADVGATTFWDVRLQNSGALVPQAVGYLALPAGLAGLGEASLDAFGRRGAGMGDRNALSWIIVEGGQGTRGGPEGRDVDETRWLALAGLDPFRREDEDGDVHRGGLAILHVRSRLDVDDAGVDLAGWGLAAGYGYEGLDGLRLTAAAEILRWDASVETAQRGDVGDTGGWGVVTGFDAGWRLPVGPGVTATPHAGILWQHHRLDSFDDTDGVSVAPLTVESLRLAGGLTLQAVWHDTTAWAKLGVSHELRGDTEVELGGVRFDAPGGGTTGTLAAGVSAALDHRTDLVLDVGRRVAFDDEGEDGWTANVGLRLAF